MHTPKNSKNARAVTRTTPEICQTPVPSHPGTKYPVRGNPSLRCTPMKYGNMYTDEGRNSVGKGVNAGWPSGMLLASDSCPSSVFVCPCINFITTFFHLSRLGGGCGETQRCSRQSLSSGVGLLCGERNPLQPLLPIWKYAHRIWKSPNMEIRRTRRRAIGVRDIN